MKIGAMNHPQHEVLDEIRWMAEMGLDFIDLSLEPPAAGPWQVDPRAIRKGLTDHHLGVVGHTAYYLPMASPFPQVRKGALAELRACLEMFAEIGARWMNLHPDRYAPMHDRSFFIQRNIESLQELLELGRKLGVGLMIENLPGDFNTPAQLGELLDPLPELGLHLDIGHSNLLTSYNTAEEIIRQYGSRLVHVHLHDNRGGSADLHLPLGAGNVDVRRHIRALKEVGYNGTITLEVFSEDRQLLAYSRDVLRRLWGGA